MDNYDTEFVNVNNVCIKYELDIKNEIPEENYTKDIDELFNRATKCGDIFVFDDGKFTSSCYFCNSQFTNYEEFINHIKLSHPILIKQNSEETLIDGGQEIQVNTNKVEFDQIPILENNVTDAMEDVIIPEVDGNDQKFECDYCGRDFRTEIGLANHRKFHEKPSKENGLNDDMEGLLNCRFCDRAFKTSNKRKFHETMHTGERAFSCPVCSKGFRGAHALKIHMYSHSKEKPHECPQCGRGFGLKRSLVRHMERLHTGQRPYKCEPCGQDLESAVTLCAHKKQHRINERKFESVTAGSSPKQHMAPHSDEKSFKCNNNRVEFDENSIPKNSATDEIQDVIIPEVDSNDQKYECDYCGRDFRTEMGLTNHRKFHEKPSKENGLNDDMEGLLNCRFCDRAFKTSNKRRFHETMHTDERAFSCPVCSKTFRRAHSVKIHMHSHTKEKPYECPECGRAFSIKRGLVRHMRRLHLNEKSFKCDHCDASFFSGTQKAIHMRIHTGERPYQCEQCGEDFRSAVTLFAHKKRHHIKERKFECKVCDKKFITSSCLKQHMASHSDEKPFKCKICSTAYNRARSLSHHMKLHSAVKEYACEICGKEFAQSPGLYSHMKSHGIKMQKKPKGNKDNEEN